MLVSLFIKNSSTFNIVKNLIPMSFHFVVLMFYLFSVSSAVLIIRYSGAHKEYYLRYGTVPHFIDDPFEKFTLRMRRKICKIVVTTKQFMTLNEADMFPNDFTYFEPQSLEYFQYVRKEVQLGNLKSFIPVFVCPKTEGWTVYLTYGLKEKQLFLIELNSLLPPPALIINSIIEANALVNENSNVEDMETDLWHRLERDPNWQRRDIPDSMKLCNLQVNEHLRLCSSIFEVLVRNGYLNLELENRNFLKISRRCVKRLINIRRRIHTAPVSVLPCIIKRDYLPRMYYDFYVIANSKQDGSAFVLTNINLRDRRVRLLTRVNKIGVLMGLEVAHK